MTEYIEREALDDFKDDLMGRFIALCFGNDYNKLNLLTIGNKIDELYEKHSTRPAADVVEVRHGEWKEETEYYADDYSECNVRKVFACSICGRTEKRKEPYCNCAQRWMERKQ